MIRDRLAELRAIQRNELHNDITISIQNEDFMKEFFIEVEEIAECINEVGTNIKTIEKKYDTIVFSDPDTEKKIKEELDILMNLVSKLSKKVRTKLKEIEEYVEKNQSNQTSAKYRIHQLQLNVLSRQFIEIMTEYNRIQTEYKKKCEDRIKKQLNITGQVITDMQLEEMLESENPAIFTQDIMMETKKAQETVADINARHNDIIKLEKSIKELHEMFIDMAMLVDSQGEMIDKIEYNVQNTAEYTGSAKIALINAAEHQKKSRRLKIIIIAIVAIIIIIIIGVSIGASRS